MKCSFFDDIIKGEVRRLRWLSWVTRSSWIPPGANIPGLLDGPLLCGGLINQVFCRGCRWGGRGDGTVRPRKVLSAFGSIVLEESAKRICCQLAGLNWALTTANEGRSPEERPWTVFTFHELRPWGRLYKAIKGRKRIHGIFIIYSNKN